MKTRILIVDDEPYARERIRDLLGSDPQCEIIGESGNGPETITFIEKQKPDLVFLDVQMPELNGFEVLENLNKDFLPQIIFVTAYDKYAIKAFEFHAIDYLLKPYTKSRFQKALQRAKEQIKLKKKGEINSHYLKELLYDIKSEQKYVERLIIKSEGRIFFLKTDEIQWIESAHNYVILHSGKEKHFYRETMTGIEKKLQPEKFMRIHRSTIVNINFIKEIQPWFSHEQIIILKDGTKLTMSRTYKEKLKKYF